MAKGERYRTEEGRLCIDLRVRRVQQLFDGRDPAPFRERDLDGHAVDYLLGALEDLPRKALVKIVISVDEPLPADISEGTVAAAIAAQFDYDETRIRREIRKHVRRAQFALVVGLVALVVLLSLGELVISGGSGHVRQVVREGLVITGWVAMWRPLEALLYDWWPMWTERRNRLRLRGAPVEVRPPRVAPPTLRGVKGAEAPAGSP